MVSEAGDGSGAFKIALGPWERVACTRWGRAAPRWSHGTDSAVIACVTVGNTSRALQGTTTGRAIMERTPARSWSATTLVTSGIAGQPLIGLKARRDDRAWSVRGAGESDPLTGGSGPLLAR